MFLNRSEYDRGPNTFSPEGRLFQVRDQTNTSSSPDIQIRVSESDLDPVFWLYGRLQLAWNGLYGQYGCAEFTPTGDYLEFLLLLSESYQNSTAIMGNSFEKN